MEKLSMCRICLAQNIRLHYLVDTNLQDTYETLTEMPFEKKDRPSQVCYICCAKLRNCYQLRTTCLRSEELFSLMLANDELKPMQSQNYNSFKKAHMVLSCSSGPEAAMSYDNVDFVTTMPTADAHIKIEAVEENSMEQEDGSQCSTKESTFVMDKGTIEDDDMLAFSIHTVKIEDNSADNNSKENHICAIEPKVEVCFGGDEEGINSKLDVKEMTRKTVKTADDLWKSSAIVSKRLDQADLEEKPVSNSSKGIEFKVKQKNNINIIQSIHENNAHKKAANVNDDCFNHTLNLLEAIPEQTGDKHHKCDICLKYFQFKRQLTRHLSIHTVETSYKCDVCKKVFNKKCLFSKHIRTHSGDRPYNCDTCGKRFKHKPDLTSHIRTHTGEKPFKCNICGKCFSQQGNLTSHMPIHTGVKPYKCDICGNSFRQKNSLTIHVRVHTGEKPYKCDNCEKRYLRKCDLVNHARQHTGENPYSCNTCGRCFNEKRKLTRHIGLHTGYKPYKCNICEKGYKYKIDLLTHVRQHTGENPYSCDTCGRCFNEKKKLTRHLSLHTGYKPHKCDVCEKGFILKAHLSRHILTHKGGKFMCDTCGKAYSRKFALSKHILIHNDI